MKPPVRRRSAPTRFDGENPPPARAAPIRLAWSSRQKIDLLRGLKAQIDQKVPHPPVRARSESEVSAYIDWLRGRAAREAVQTIYEEWVQERKAQEAETPAPIELWTDLVCRMSSPTEEAVAAAFSQMLTIASTEPVTLRHSIPSKEPRKRSSCRPAKKSTKLGKRTLEEEPGDSGAGLDCAEEGSTSLGEQPTPSEERTTATEPADDRWKKLEFDKIYKYLSKLATGETLPKLSECESAVVLHLLNCIPDQIQTLDARPLGCHFRQAYVYMTAPARSGNTKETEKSSEPQPADWSELGFCPLNPFQLPLRLLNPKEETNEPS